MSMMGYKGPEGALFALIFDLARVVLALIMANDADFVRLCDP